MVNYGASKKRITLDHLFLTFKSFLDRWHLKFRSSINNT